MVCLYKVHLAVSSERAATASFLCISVFKQNKEAKGSRGRDKAKDRERDRDRQTKGEKSVRE